MVSRAPEIMLSCKEYTQAIDMWSIGCIFAEMLGRKYLFPGETYVQQLSLILNVVGSPSTSFIDQIGSEKVAEYLRKLPHYPPIPLSKVYKDVRFLHAQNESWYDDDGDNNDNNDDNNHYYW